MTAERDERVWGRLIWMMVGDTALLKLLGEPVEVGEVLYLRGATVGEVEPVKVVAKRTQGYRVDYKVKPLDEHLLPAPRKTLVLGEGCLCTRRA